MMSDEQIVEHFRSSNSDYREMEESHHRLDAELQTLLQNHTCPKIVGIFERASMEKPST